MIIFKKCYSIRTQVFFHNERVDQMSFGRMVFDEKTWNNLENDQPQTANFAFFFRPKLHLHDGEKSQ
jgi:hypothetical protein